MAVASRNANLEAQIAADRVRAMELTQGEVSRETWDRLDGLVAQVLKWQKSIQLIAPSTIPVIWTRHVADSLQLLPLAGEARVFVDLGSGGGFPGLVVACALADRPGATVHLVESVAKKAAFLRESARMLSLPAVVHAERIEDFIAKFPGPVDVVTARAVASLTQLLAYANPLLKTGARGLFPKGQDVEAELTTASKYWNIDYQLFPSRTEARGRIVLVKRAEKRAKIG